jgi:CO/xanthine dehydrogenase FAD-binding subunit
VIPATFSYHRPKSIAEATSLLAQHSDEARVLAGGQSLIPMMKLRLAAPEHLIDLGGIAELKGVQRNGNTLVIGATTTQHELQQSKIALDAAPILREASLLIADPQVRYVGTLGGNIANGDPGNDMPAVMICLDATYRVVGHGGVQTIKARDFYEGIYATALKPDQIVTAVEIPVPPRSSNARWATMPPRRPASSSRCGAARWRAARSRSPTLPTARCSPRTRQLRSWAVPWTRTPSRPPPGLPGPSWHRPPTRAGLPSTASRWAA